MTTLDTIPQVTLETILATTARAIGQGEANNVAVLLAMYVKRVMVNNATIDKVSRDVLDTMLAAGMPVSTAYRQRKAALDVFGKVKGAFPDHVRTLAIKAANSDETAYSEAQGFLSDMLIHTQKDVAYWIGNACLPLTTALKQAKAQDEKARMEAPKAEAAAKVAKPAKPEVEPEQAKPLDMGDITKHVSGLAHDAKAAMVKQFIETLDEQGLRDCIAAANARLKAIIEQRKAAAQIDAKALKAA